MGANQPSFRSRSARVRRWAGEAWRAITAASATDGMAGRLVTTFIVFAAALPYAAWPLPTGWLAGMLALIAAERLWATRASNDPDEINPGDWLLSAGYSAAAFYLVLLFNGPAQTLGVTLYGVAMFQTLARDHDRPRRLAANLVAPVASLIAVQLAAAGLIVARGRPWELITLAASPYVVFRTVRIVHENLDRSRRLERRALEQLAESEARYRLMADNSPDVIIRYDLKGRIEYLSPAARLYGAAPAAFVGRNVRDFLDPAYWARNDAFLQAVARGDTLPRGAQNIWQSLMPNGRAVFFEGATSPITAGDGEVVGAIAVLRDVTRRQALEDELRRKSTEAEAATVAKSQFLANMSHEIRTPLTGVIGFAGLLKSMGDLPADARRYAERIHKSADALLSVVNDVLDFSKLEADQMDLDPRPTDPSALVEDTVDLIRHRAAEKGLEIDIHGTAMPATVLADAPRLRQVLLNLLTNAVKFTDRGAISIEAHHAAGELAVSVRDTGPGVPAQLAGRLFQRFSQVDGSNARQHGGTGLGLAISKALVELMGGQIGMQSEPGRGSTFWFRVPAPATEAPRQAGPECGAGVMLKPVRVLVVDDVAVNRELVGAILSAFDADVHEAASGAEAIEASAATAFDVILMDLQMPEMDGLAATAAIRGRPGPNSGTPIVALSANVLPAQVEACLAGGMNDHVAKPIDAAELLSKVAMWTQAGEAPAVVEQAAG
jgi:PAS domain S-box-containing protein